MKSGKVKFSAAGSVVAIVTPMRADGGVDDGAFVNLLDWHLRSGTKAVLVAGTTGESPALTLDENRRLIADAAKWSGGRMPIVGGVGANATAEAVALARHAAEDGADAGLSVVPYYNKPTQEGLYRHFSAVADASDLPIILYDVPKRCVATFATDTLERLAAHPNIVGIKDATGDIARLAEHRQRLPEDFLFYSGDDGTAMDYILGGGGGVMSVTANIAPAAMQAAAEAAIAGDADSARRLDAPLRAFHEAQSAESNPIPVKWALAESGRIAPALRLPLTPLSSQYHQAVREAMNSCPRENP